LAKLNILANQILAKSAGVPQSILENPKPGKLKIELKGRYWLVDEFGRQAAIRIVGTYGKDAIIRDVAITGKSKTLDRLKRYDLIEKAIIGTGLFDLFK
jgi:hypothetical protein